VFSILRLEHLIEYLGEQPEAAADLERILVYREEYGV
jgi:hypothetical protein